jgi:hypothetical protein
LGFGLGRTDRDEVVMKWSREAGDTGLRPTVARLDKKLRLSYHFFSKT